MNEISAYVLAVLAVTFFLFIPSLAVGLYREGSFRQWLLGWVMNIAGIVLWTYFVLLVAANLYSGAGA